MENPNLKMSFLFIMDYCSPSHSGTHFDIGVALLIPASTGSSAAPTFAFFLTTALGGLGLRVSRVGRGRLTLIVIIAGIPIVGVVAAVAGRVGRHVALRVVREGVGKVVVGGVGIGIGDVAHVA